ncbi:SagB family peptide dehydrogenase [Streptomyces sp. NPDC006539]|uniref:SagB family peptide dehydrogenase n=1 Tax=Streptomyces sp. NPDC006539 TaxID=3155352 RepID=UPI0033B13347
MTETYQLDEAAEIGTGADGAVTVRSPLRGAVLGRMTAGQLAVLRALATGAHTADGLAAVATAKDGWAAGVLCSHRLLTALERHHWVRTVVWDGDRRILTVCPPVAGEAALRQDGEAAPEVPARPLVLSRFALLRRDGDRTILESPRTGIVIELHDTRLMALLAEPLPPARVRELTAGGGWAGPALGVLVRHGFLVPHGSAADTGPALSRWTPHELWFHARSGGPDGRSPWGATGPAVGAAPPSARRPGFGGPVIPLPRPDLPRVSAGDPSLTEVLERRRSVRTHDHAEPITAAQLGEFLFRTARTRRIWTQGGVELADRPYPSGGALHELEIYLVITAAAGVPPGLHHYDGTHHTLRQVACEGPKVRRLADRAGRAAAMAGAPQVVLVLAARFGRLMWKYQSMAYALALRNTGVLYATMYQVATAMGLAPCALGTGDPEAFARASGLDPLAEAGVGQFLLGSCPPRLSVVPAAGGRQR